MDRHYCLMLVELLNRTLKENKHSLEELCTAYWKDKEDIILQTLSVDYHYDKTLNQFI